MAKWWEQEQVPPPPPAARRRMARRRVDDDFFERERALEEEAFVQDREDDSQTQRALNQSGAQLRAAPSAVRGLFRTLTGDEERGQADLQEAKGIIDREARFAPDVQRLEDIEDAGDVGAYARNAVLSNLPTMLPTIAGAAATGGASALAGAGLRSLAKKGVGAAIGRGLTARTGTSAGALAGSSAVQSNQMLDAALDEDSPDSARTRAAKATVGAITTGALDALPQISLLNRLGLGGAAKRAIAPQLQQHLATRMAKSAGKQATQEGLTETIQTVGENLTHKWVNDNVEVIGPGAFSEYLNAAVAGALVGGVIGTTGGIRNPARKRAEGELKWFRDRRQQEPRPAADFDAGATTKPSAAPSPPTAKGAPAASEKPVADILKENEQAVTDGKPTPGGFINALFGRNEDLLKDADEPSLLDSLEQKFQQIDRAGRADSEELGIIGRTQDDGIVRGDVPYDGWSLFNAEQAQAIWETAKQTGRRITVGDAFAITSLPPGMHEQVGDKAIKAAGKYLLTGDRNQVNEADLVTYLEALDQPQRIQFMFAASHLAERIAKTRELEGVTGELTVSDVRKTMSTQDEPLRTKVDIEDKQVYDELSPDPDDMAGFSDFQETMSMLEEDRPVPVSLNEVVKKLPFVNTRDGAREGALRVTNSKGNPRDISLASLVAQGWQAVGDGVFDAPNGVVDVVAQAIDVLQQRGMKVDPSQIKAGLWVGGDTRLSAAQAKTIRDGMQPHRQRRVQESPGVPNVPEGARPYDNTVNETTEQEVMREDGVENVDGPDTTLRPRTRSPLGTRVDPRGRLQEAETVDTEAADDVSADTRRIENDAIAAMDRAATELGGKLTGRTLKDKMESLGKLVKAAGKLTDRQDSLVRGARSAVRRIERNQDQYNERAATTVDPVDTVIAEQRARDTKEEFEDANRLAAGVPAELKAKPVTGKRTLVKKQPPKDAVADEDFSVDDLVEDAGTAQDLVREQEFLDEIVSRLGLDRIQLKAMTPGRKEFGLYSPSKRTIWISAKRKGNARLDTILHELGHAVVFDTYESLSAEQKAEIKADYNAWLQEAMREKTWMGARQSRAPFFLKKWLDDHRGKNTKSRDMMDLSQDQLNDLLSFDEYLADHLARAMGKNPTTRGAVAKFFKELAAKLQELYEFFSGTKYEPAASVEAWVDSLIRGQMAQAINAQPLAMQIQFHSAHQLQLGNKPKNWFQMTLDEAGDGDYEFKALEKIAGPELWAQVRARMTIGSLIMTDDLVGIESDETIRKMLSRFDRAEGEVFVPEPSSKLLTASEVHEVLKRKADAVEQARADVNKAKQERTRIIKEFRGKRPPNERTAARKRLTQLEREIAQLVRTHDRLVTKQVSSREYERYLETLQSRPQLLAEFGRLKTTVAHEDIRHNIYVPKVIERLRVVANSIAIAGDNQARRAQFNVEVGKSNDIVPYEKIEAAYKLFARMDGKPLPALLKAALPHVTPSQAVVIRALLKNNKAIASTTFVNEPVDVSMFDDPADVTGGVSLTAGMTTLDASTVTLNPVDAGRDKPALDPFNTMIHEATHAATLLAENADADLAREIHRLLEFAQAQAQVIGIPQEYFYGLSESQEFMAEAMADPDFRAFLHSIKLPSIGKEAPKTVWQRLMELIGRVVFGREPTPTQLTLLDEVMRATSELVARQANLDLDAARAQMKSQLNEGYGSAITLPVNNVFADADVPSATPGQAANGAPRPSNLFGLLNTRDRGIMERALRNRGVYDQIYAAADADTKRKLDLYGKDLSILINLGAALYAQGRLNIDAGKSVFDKLLNMLRKVLGLPSNADVAKQIMNDFEANQIQNRRYDGEARAFDKNAYTKNVLAIQRGVQRVVQPVYDKLLMDMGTRLRETNNPALRVIASLMETRSGERAGEESFVQVRQSYTIKHATEYMNVAGDLKDDQKRQLARALQKNQRPDGVLGEKFDQMKELMENYRLWYNANNFGSEIKKRKDYFPIAMDRKRVEEGWDALAALLNKPQYEADIRKVFKDNETALATLVDRMVQIAATADISHVGEVNFAIGEYAPAMTAMRQQIMGFLDNVDRAALAEFQTDSLDAVVLGYVNQMSKKAAFHKVFGTTSRRVRPNGGTEIVPNRLGKLMDAARRQGATPEQMKMAKDFVNMVLGSYHAELNPAFRWVFRQIDKVWGTELADMPIEQFAHYQQAAMFYNNLRLLGLAGLASLIDSIGSLARGGSVTGATASIWDGIKAMRNEDNGLRGMAEYLGIVEKYALADALAATYGGSFDPQGKIGKLNNALFRFNGLEQITRHSRYAALAMGHRFLLQHAHRPGKHSARHLKDLELTAADVQVDPNNPNFVVLNPKTEAALRRFVTEAVVRPQPSQRPGWHNDPNFLFAAQYKGYLYAFYTTIVGRMLYEADQGNYRMALAPIMPYLGVTVVAEMTRYAIQHPDEEDPRDAEEYMRLAMIRSGLVGPRFGIFHDARTDARYGNWITNGWIGPTGQQISDVVQVATGDRSASRTAIQALPGSAIFDDWEFTNGQE